jgi:hypothetical protein
MSAAKQSKPMKPPRVTITLARDHIHERKPYKTGSEIEIPETLLDWFRQQGLVKEG